MRGDIGRLLHLTDSRRAAQAPSHAHAPSPSAPARVVQPHLLGPARVADSRRSWILPGPCHPAHPPTARTCVCTGAGCERRPAGGARRICHRRLRRGRRGGLCLRVGGWRAETWRVAGVWGGGGSVHESTKCGVVCSGTSVSHPTPAPCPLPPAPCPTPLAMQRAGWGMRACLACGGWRHAPCALPGEFGGGPLRQLPW